MASLTATHSLTAGSAPPALPGEVVQGCTEREGSIVETYFQIFLFIDCLRIISKQDKARTVHERLVVLSTNRILCKYNLQLGIFVNS